MHSDIEEKNDDCNLKADNFRFLQNFSVFLNFLQIYPAPTLGVKNERLSTVPTTLTKITAVNNRYFL